MAPTKTSSIATICLTINLLSFTFVSSCNTCVFPNPKTPSTSGVDHHCPRDALKLGICANVLNGPVGAVIGSPPNHPCCSILAGLLDLEAAVCLCTAIKANILGININIPIALSLLINVCGKTLPSDFQCA